MLLSQKKKKNRKIKQGSNAIFTRWTIDVVVVAPIFPDPRLPIFVSTCVAYYVNYLPGRKKRQTKKIGTKNRSANSLSWKLVAPSLSTPRYPSLSLSTSSAQCGAINIVGHVEIHKAILTVLMFFLSFFFPTQWAGTWGHLWGPIGIKYIYFSPIDLILF